MLCDCIWPYCILLGLYKLEPLDHPVTEQVCAISSNSKCSEVLWQVSQCFKCFKFSVLSCFGDLKYLMFLLQQQQRGTATPERVVGVTDKRVLFHSPSAPLFSKAVIKMWLVSNPTNNSVLKCRKSPVSDWQLYKARVSERGVSKAKKSLKVHLLSQTAKSWMQRKRPQKKSQVISQWAHGCYESLDGLDRRSK